MKIFFSGFWGGFTDGSDPVNQGFFIKLIRDLFCDESISVGETVSECDILFESCFGACTQAQNKNFKFRFAFSGESYIKPAWNELMDCIFSAKSGTDNLKIINLPFFYVFNEANSVKLPCQVTNFPEKNICAIISNGNGRDRNRLLDIIESHFRIDHGGKFRNNIDMIIQGNYNSSEIRDFIRQYKCVVAIENYGDNNGYITEKIFHGFNNGTVPIYWGGQDVKTYFNDTRFVNLNGKSDQEVVNEIGRVLSLNKEQYLAMVNEPIYKRQFDYQKMLEETRHLINLVITTAPVPTPMSSSLPSQNEETDAKIITPTPSLAPKRPTILLNMIVKNEAHVIEKTLANLTEKIAFSYYVISDTGSTDDTKLKIKNFFDSKNIPGEIYDDPWQDFGYNRTQALKHAFNKSDLLLVFDADDELKGTFPVVASVDFDAYQLHFGDGYTLNYWRVCLVNNRKMWKYIGVLHEYITPDDEGNKKLNSKKKNNPNAYLHGDYYIVHGVSGGRSADPLKYHKDAEILSKAFHELPEADELRNRYAFYCANSYRDASNTDKAIEWYQIAVKLPGWAQEKYRCCIQLANLYKMKNETEKSLYWCTKSVAFDKTRVEGIFKLVQQYCCENQNDVAFMYYTLVGDWYERVYLNATDAILADKLFVDILEFDFFLPYYMIIVSDKIGRREIGVTMYKLIFKKGKVAGQWWMDNLCFNFQFFFKLIDEKDRKEMTIKAKEYIKTMLENNLKVKESFLQNVYEMSMKCL
jgi:hypothetical protein